VSVLASPAGMLAWLIVTGPSALIVTPARNVTLQPTNE
jgi:hypothetical protein